MIHELWDRYLTWIDELRQLWPSTRAEQRTRHASALPAEAQVLEQVDYRDRISVVTWIVVFGLGLSLLFSLPHAFHLSFMALGSPVAFEVTDHVISAAFLAVLVAAGTQGVVGVHPALVTARGARWRSWIFAALPMALTILATYLLPLAPTRAMQVLALLASGGFVALALFCLYATVERGQAGFRRARFTLNALAYGAALLLFLFVYQTRTRSLVSATVIAITATLLAVEILRNTTAGVDWAFIYGAIIGLVLGQVTWALNYWPVPALTGGLLLLLIFYLLAGIAQQGLQKQINGRIVLEFAIFAVVALLLIALIGPGFG